MTDAKPPSCPEQRRLAYTAIREDIAAHKASSWKVTNYAALLYGAFLAIARHEVNGTVVYVSPLWWVPWVVAVVALVQLVQLRWSLYGSRLRLHHAEEGLHTLDTIMAAGRTREFVPIASCPLALVILGGVVVVRLLLGGQYFRIEAVMACALWAAFLAFDVWLTWCKEPRRARSASGVQAGTSKPHELRGGRLSATVAEKRADQTEPRKR